MNAKTREWKNGNEDIFLIQVTLYLWLACLASKPNGASFGRNLAQMDTHN
jgi:hypothetical protein